MEIKQASFQAPDDLDEATQYPLIIHSKHTLDNKDNHLIIFIHGLGGHRYGDKSTWGNFPKFISRMFHNLMLACTSTALRFVDWFSGNQYHLERKPEYWLKLFVMNFQSINLLFLLGIVWVDCYARQ